MRKIAIFGPGLLGGSIALKLRALGGWHIGLWARRAAALADLRARGLADLVSSDIAEIACDADLVVLCVPIEAMGALAREIARFIPSRCVVTDVGSVKGCVDAELAPIFAGKCRYVGSHPMAGKAEAGIAAAEAGLFAGTNCIITTPDADVQAFWETLGCRVVTMSAREHDECVALISHLPHLVAGNLVRAVAEKNARAFAVVGRPRRSRRDAGEAHRLPPNPRPNRQRRATPSSPRRSKADARQYLASPAKIIPPLFLSPPPDFISAKADTQTGRSLAGHSSQRAGPRA